MKLLVVGASGFLGRNVVRAAVDGDWEVEGVFCTSSDFPAFAARYGCLATKQDLLKQSRKWDADVCIYLAGNANHMASVSSPTDDLRLNAEALARFLQDYAGALVLMSSAAVYDGSVGLVSPATRLSPRLPYAISKMAAERYVWHSAHTRKLDWATVLRLYYGYGPHERESRLVPRIMQAAGSSNKEFVVTAPRGSVVDPLFVEDVAHAALRAADGLAKGATLDLCGGRPMTVTRFVQDVAAACGWRLRIVSRPRKGEAPLRFHSSPRPALRKLRIDRFTSLAEGLRRYVQWRREAV